MIGILDLPVDIICQLKSPRPLNTPEKLGRFIMGPHVGSKLAKEKSLTECLEKIVKKQSKRVSGIPSPDKRGVLEPANKIGNDIVQAIKDHINSYTLYESHYSRSHTNRRYLPSGLSL